MRMLICQLRNHGDIIRTFPLIDAIKNIHSDWYIGFTCYPEMVETCRLCKNIDTVIPQPHFSQVTDTQGGTRILDCSIFQECVDIVRKSKFDVYIDLHGVFLFSVFGAMCDIKTRLGRSSETAKDGAALFYTDICQITEKEINRMERHFMILNVLFPEIAPISKINVAGNNVAVFPGSSKKGILKRWNTEHYIELANKLVSDHKVVFVLGVEEQDIREKLENNTRCPVKVFSAWSQVEAEISDAKLVIGNDAAFVHLAVWKNIPVIEICGPLSPVINGVWKYGIGETLYNPVRCECQNIWNGVCERAHECMEKISVDMVLDTAKKYL